MAITSLSIEASRMPNGQTESGRRVSAMSNDA
jgi:hypothetical protein